jgi:predicted DNA-binding transcriptional regulator YafY
VVREALRQGRKLRLAYRRSGSQASSERTIAPYLLLSASGMLYIVAFCEREQTTRLFRIDRVESVALMDETFERPDAAVLDTLLRERRAFQGDGAPHHARALLTAHCAMDRRAGRKGAGG